MKNGGKVILRKLVQEVITSSTEPYERYGEENFLVEEVLTVSSPTKEKLKAKLDFLEQHFIQKFDTFRNGMFGKKQSKEVIMASSIRVFQFNSNGEFIKEFISISEVKRKFGIGKKILKRNIKNGTPVMGFIWKYEK